MKKKIALILTMALAASSLAACGGQPPPQQRRQLATAPKRLQITAARRQRARTLTQRSAILP